MSKTNRIAVPLVVPLAMALALAGCAATGPETSAEASPLLAEGDGPPPWPGPGHAPPHAAFDACAGKAAGDACSVTLPDRDVAGSCVTPPEDAPETELFCLPADAPRHPGGPRAHRGPPPEAFTACEGVPVGDACTVTRGDDVIEGRCLPPPWDEDAAADCVPEGGRRGPRD